MSGFKKFDKNKARFDLIDPWLLEELAKVLTLGADKYGAENWKNCEDPARYVAALERHWNAYRRGEEVDPESGLTHLAHVMCNTMFLRWFDRQVAERARQAARTVVGSVDSTVARPPIKFYSDC